MPTATAAACGYDTSDGHILFHSGEIQFSNRAYYFLLCH
jgi:hypothetical protein